MNEFIPSNRQDLPGERMGGAFEHHVSELGEEFETTNFELLGEPIRTDDGGYVALFHAAERDEIFIIRDYGEPRVYIRYSRDEITELGKGSFDHGIHELLNKFCNNTFSKL